MSAIGMLSGFCGTLMTPMAANFNLVPVFVLGLKDRYAVIRVPSDGRDSSLRQHGADVCPRLPLLDRSRSMKNGRRDLRASHLGMSRANIRTWRPRPKHGIRSSMAASTGILACTPIGCSRRCSGFIPA